MASPNVTYEEVVAGGPDAIVRAIAASRARARLNFRLIFVLTWLILVGGLVIAIASTGRVDPAFLAIWAPLILSGIPITIAVSVCSIAFATLFAIIGALGRLSRNAPIYAIATLYVSLVRGTPLIVQVFVIYSALPEFGIVLPPFVAGVVALVVQLRRVHDGDLPRRHPGHPAGPGRGGPGARHDRAARRCAGSCCRRRSGSSSRRSATSSSR